MIEKFKGCFRYRDDYELKNLTVVQAKINEIIDHLNHKKPFGSTKLDTDKYLICVDCKRTTSLSWDDEMYQCVVCESVTFRVGMTPV